LAKGTPVLFDQLQKDVHSFLRANVRVEFLVGAIRFRKTVENLGDVFHAGMSTTASLVRSTIVHLPQAEPLLGWATRQPRG
jgi:hypothetical protein